MEYKLFQVAILELPKRNTGKTEDEGYKALPKIVLEPVTVVARNEQDAALKVAMSQSSKLTGVDQERVEVVVRPF